MSDFYSVSGALSMHEEQLGMLRKLLAENKDQNPYIDSWLFHTDGGWSSYAFFGHTVRVSSLDKVRAQIERIALTIHLNDPDVEWLDFVDGVFWVVYADGTPSYEWILSDGKFLERKHA